MAPLLWIAEGAERAGLAFDAPLMDVYRQNRHPAAPFPTHHRTISDFLLTITGESDRVGPDSIDGISTAARERWTALPAYRPPPLMTYSAELSR